VLGRNIAERAEPAATELGARCPSLLFTAGWTTTAVAFVLTTPRRPAWESRARRWRRDRRRDRGARAEAHPSAAVADRERKHRHSRGAAARRSRQRLPRPATTRLNAGRARRVYLTPRRSGRRCPLPTRCSGNRRPARQARRATPCSGSRRGRQCARASPALAPGPRRDR
jgi:hypothetical protein